MSEVRDELVDVLHHLLLSSASPRSDEWADTILASDWFRQIKHDAWAEGYVYARGVDPLRWDNPYQKD